MGEDRSFAARWSARKQAVKDEEAREEEAREVEAVADAPAEPEKTDAEILAELNLKDPDEMEAGDDFSGFMNASIPQRLRNRALRKLWTTNPALANLDELLDYGEDFTGKGEIVETLKTAYQVGKGYLSRPGEEDLPPASDSPAAPEITEDDEEENPALNLEEGEDSQDTAESAETALPQPEADLRASRRKRMNFRF